MRRVRISVRALWAAALALPLVACGQVPVVLSSVSPPTPSPAARALLFVGDSLTRGYYATAPADRYVARVLDAFPGPVSAQVVAVYGTTTLASDLALRQTALQPAQAVVVELGTNDPHATPADLAAFGPHYRALLAQLQAAEPLAHFLCLGVWEMPDDPRNAQIAAACPGTFVPIGQVYQTWPDHGPAGRATTLGPGDWFHPNSLGHAAIALAVTNALLRALT